MARLDGVDVLRAQAFAEGAHAGQVRKYTGEPYATHTSAVADLVAAAGLPAEVVAAAHLHDTLEDTKATRADLVRLFGEEVARLVVEVTEVSKKGQGNRAFRKALDLAHYAKASPHGQSVKVADLIDNTASIVAHDPTFAIVYLDEKASLLSALHHAEPGLLARAWATLDKAREQLGLAPARCHPHLGLHSMPHRGCVLR